MNTRELFAMLLLVTLVADRVFHRERIQPIFLQDKAYSLLTSMLFKAVEISIPVFCTPTPPKNSFPPRINIGCGYGPATATLKNIEHIINHGSCEAVHYMLINLNSLPDIFNHEESLQDHIITSYVLNNFAKIPTPESFGGSWCQFWINLT
uniref:Uncharacterized protein n=1 Tax=Lactuca sativa TaxID=4236 RepID=A0A9R1VV71_LACSA|nr:hypothetical protein LSAT_V11C400173750 [Lactuca sativa]